MAEAAQSFSALIDTLEIGDPRMPVLASNTGEPLASASGLREELKHHMLVPVNWVASMARVSRDACAPVIECGPGRILKGLALRNKLPERCFTTGTLKELAETMRIVTEASCVRS